jgi:hypothetical protein
MATLGDQIAVAVAVALAGCSDLHGLDPEQLSPLASVHVRVTGDLDAVRPPGSGQPRLRVMIFWGDSWLPDASCLPPFENAQHAAVAALGCGDPLSFRALFSPAEGAAFGADGIATLDLYSLPSMLFGDMYSQIAYGSLIVYDDSDGDGSMAPFTEFAYGASFTSMARPDTRLAFRHGGFDDRSAFYPRRGCAPPAPGYSILSTGGFTLEQAIEAQARGELPAQDPAQCRQDAIDHEVAVELRPPEDLADVRCPGFGFGFSPPPPEPFPDEPRFITACTSIPDRGTGRARGRSQLLAADEFFRGCKFLSHYVLRGCYADPLCEVPEWEVAPPSWWPCPPEDPP